MSTTNPHDRPTLAPAVEAVLDSLRRRIRQYIWLEGCGGAVTWLGVAFWATLGIDWFFEPPVPVRAAMLAVAAVVLAAIVVQRIGRRAFVRITPSNAATVLERRFPQLNDALLTAVVLTDPSGRHAPRAETPEEAAMGRQMLAQTCREAAAGIADVDLRQVFNPQPLRQKCIAAGLLVLSIAFYAILSPEGLQIWARRTLALSDELWPRSTRLEVEGFRGGVQKVARGADLEVVARADAAMRVPQVVEVLYRTQGGNRGRKRMDRRGVARGPEDRFQEYAYTFRSVLADVRFDVAGGDDRVSNLWIQAVDSPTVSRMTLDCELPAYIGRPRLKLPVSGVMQIPAGSRVTVQAGAANKDLVQVQINCAVDGVSPQADSRQHETPPHCNGGELGGHSSEAALSADRRGFSFALDPLEKDTTLLFTLTDSDGIRGRDPVRLALEPLPDQPPRVAVQLDGIGTAVTPQARVPAVGRISDDYGLGRAWFEHAIDQRRPGRHIIGEFSDRPIDVKLAKVWLDMSELAIQPGQKLLLCVKAADLCDLGRGPNVTSSDRWTLDVVTPDQLRAMLDARELVLRQRFDAMIQEMTETRDLLARLEFTPPVKPRPVVAPNGHGFMVEPGDDEPPDSPARQRTLRLLRVEGALTNCRKSTQEVLGLAEAFDDVRKQLVNNRIDTEELKKRLQTGIADPLRRIADPMFPELERRLDALLPALDDGQRAPRLRDLARRQAEEILLAMRKVRDRMIELEDFNEAVDLLRGIIKMQNQLHDETQRRHKEKIRELLKD